MPPRRCAGFRVECGKPLSVWNTDSVCGVCSERRALAIIEANTRRAAK
jgi:hypothetical protein